MERTGAVIRRAGRGRAVRGCAAAAAVLILSAGACVGAEGRRIERVMAAPSVKGGEVAVQIVLAGPGAAGRVKVAAEFAEAVGQAPSRFSSEARDPGGDGAVVKCVWKWDKAALWEIGAPKMMRLSVAVEGEGFRGDRAGPFGFREFGIEGREFRMNGTRVRLRPAPAPAGGTVEAIEAELRRLWGEGFNAVVCDPSLKGPGEPDAALLCEAASKLGMAVAAPLPGFAAAVDGWREASAPGRADWKQTVAREMGRLGGWPAVVMWVVEGAGLGHGDDLHPPRLGVRDWPASERWRVRARAAEEALSFLRGVDSSRPFMVYDGGPAGEVYAPRVHLGWAPLQEREEWPARWAESGDMPVCAVELGGPAAEDFFAPGKGGAPEPFLAEHAAAELGAAAYGREGAGYREALRAGPAAWALPLLYGEALFQEVETRFIRGTWHAWRGWGVPGGMLPRVAPLRGGGAGGDAALAAWLAPLLEEVNGPVLGWLGGAPEEFTSKDHHFYSGARVVKSVGLVNDKRAEALFSLDWQAEVAGQEAGVGHNEGHLAAGQVRFFPVEFTAPVVNAKVAGVIRFEAQVDGVRFEEVFPIRVYPPVGGPARERAKAVHVFDPEGETTRVLRLLGVKTQVWDGRADPGRLLVVGRNALSSGLALPGSFEQFAAVGGRVLLCAQSAEWIEEQTEFRVCPRSERRFWPVATQAAHPLVAGLDAEDLRDWAGGRGPVPTSIATDPGSRLMLGPAHAWRWSERGALAIAAPEKPHFSAWRPILEGGFDLVYSPLMELEHGRGLILWSSLDIEPRVEAEPVAREMIERMLAYLEAFRPVPERGPTYFTGGEAWQRRFEAMGLDFQPVQAMPRVPGLLIVTPDSPIVDRLIEEHLGRGGSALLLPREAAVLPMGFRARTGTLFGRLDALPSWAECRGVSLAEVRLRCDSRVPLLSGGAGEVAAGGVFGRLQRGGGAVFSLQVGPDQIEGAESPCLALSESRSWRLLSQVLANMGATFRTDRTAFSAGSEPFRPLSLSGRWMARAEGEAAGKDAAGSVGERAGWGDPGFKSTGWVAAMVPGAWQDADPALAEARGAVWFRRDVVVPKLWRGRTLRVHLGRVVDEGVVYFNGTRIGSWVEGGVRIPSERVVEGRNVVAVRVWKEAGLGGMVALHDRDLHLDVEGVAPGGGYYHRGRDGALLVGERYLRLRRWGREGGLPDMDSNHD